MARLFTSSLYPGPSQMIPTENVCRTPRRCFDCLFPLVSSDYLWEMPCFWNIHTLSISQEKISSVAISPSGEWLAFGARKLGQLLVWEWQSESYVLKQQGHYFDMNTLAYAPDGQTIATGGDDGKVKVWSTYSGFCFVTFTDHSAPISSVAFAKQGSVLSSASLDGTVRAYDLIRYRNFRTFTSPSPVQFSCLAVDPSGEVVAAGSTDSYEVFLWSVQTGKLLNVMAGHTGPVSSLAFSPSGANQLASGSWDKTMRVWNIFGRSGAVEPFSSNSDVLALAFCPDGKEVAVSTLDGQITSRIASRQTSLMGGRTFLADESWTIVFQLRITLRESHTTAWRIPPTACGRKQQTCRAVQRERGRRWSKNSRFRRTFRSMGLRSFLDSGRTNDAGINVDLINDRDGSDLEDRLDTSLPGASRGAGDMFIRRFRQEARTKCVRFSPTGRAWAAASTEGLLIYSLDETVTFDPFELSIDLKPFSKSLPSRNTSRPW
jgi:periodic tryptophan protein 2